MLQSRVNQDSPTTSRALRNSGRTSSTPGALPPRSFLTTSATSAPEIGGPTPESPGPASLPEGVSVGLRRSSKYPFHRSTTSRVEVSSAPSPPYTVLTMHCFPLLRRRMVVQNLFEAVRKSFSMASPNSSHVRVFASVTATAALRLACRYLPAASGVPQAKKFDGIPHRRCPPAGSGIAATAGTDHLAATALVGRLNNGGVEHGPLGLNVPRLPRYMVKALPEAQTTVRIRPPTRRRREATLSSTGVNSNILAPSRGAISIATPARRLSPVATPEWKRVQPLSRRLVPEPLLCVEVRPTISSRNFSTSRTSSGSFPTREVTFHVPRASFCSRGSDRQGPRLRPPPSSHCTRPLWPLLLVVSRREGGPTSSFRAVPGRAPPGHQALAAEPHPQAWLQGEAPLGDHGGPQRGEVLGGHPQQQHPEEQEDLRVEDGHLGQPQALHQPLCTRKTHARDTRKAHASHMTQAAATVFLVLVHLAAVDGEGQALQQHGSLLQLGVPDESIWKKVWSMNRSKASFFQARRVYWNPLRLLSSWMHAR
ncbi:hypothetical protein N1851_015177 [Merluccius polli]|uniref:Uncharacterized protein n=1 Tax=Merluccius polli TaxID=89951 RepID=A0AA47P312_MERPO|nr:hypothetical protein N1851_015177 [Merluccius polli]